MNILLDTYALAKLKPEDIRIQHYPISVNGTEEVIIKLPISESPDPDGLTDEFYKKLGRRSNAAFPQNL